MARGHSSGSGRRRRAPARTPEEREDQLADMAYDLAEEQIAEGTASSQVVTHFLRAGSRREKIEQVRLQYDIELTKVKMEQLEAETRRDEMFAEAIEAMRGYQGLSGEVPRHLDRGDR